MHDDLQGRPPIQRTMFDPPDDPPRPHPHGPRGLDPFGTPATLGYSRYSETSQAAAESAGTRAPGARKRIYQYLKSILPDGATAHEIRERLQMNHTTVSARLVDLEDVGYASRRGATRPTDTKHEAEIYYANLMTDDDPPMPAAHLSKKDIKVRAALGKIDGLCDEATTNGGQGSWRADIAPEVRQIVADLRKELGWTD